MNDPMHRLFSDDSAPDELLAFEQATRQYTAQRIDPLEFLARVHDSGKAIRLFQRVLRLGSAVLRFTWNKLHRNSSRPEPSAKYRAELERDSVFKWMEGERPSTVTFMYCAQGSGKTTTLLSALISRHLLGGNLGSRPILVIDPRGRFPYEFTHRTMTEWLAQRDTNVEKFRPVILVDGFDEVSDAAGLSRLIHNVSPWSSLLVSCPGRVDPVPDVPARVVDVRPYLRSDTSAGHKDQLWTFLLAQAEAADMARECHRQGGTMTEAIDRILARLRLRYETVPGGFVSQTRHRVRFHVSRTVCAERFTVDDEDVIRVRTDSRLRESILDNKRTMFAAFSEDEPGWLSTRVRRLDIEQLSMVISLLDPTYQSSTYVGGNGQ